MFSQSPPDLGRGSKRLGDLKTTDAKGGTLRGDTGEKAMTTRQHVTLIVRRDETKSIVCFTDLFMKSTNSSWSKTSPTERLTCPLTATRVGEEFLSRVFFVFQALCQSVLLLSEVLHSKSSVLFQFPVRLQWQQKRMKEKHYNKRTSFQMFTASILPLHWHLAAARVKPFPACCSCKTHIYVLVK